MQNINRNQQEQTVPTIPNPNYFINNQGNNLIYNQNYPMNQTGQNMNYPYQNITIQQGNQVYPMTFVPSPSNITYPIINHHSNIIPMQPNLQKGTLPPIDLNNISAQSQAFSMPIPMQNVYKNYPATNMQYNPATDMPYNPANMPYNPANMPYNPATNMPYNYAPIKKE